MPSRPSPLGQYDAQLAEADDPDEIERLQTKRDNALALVQRQDEIEKERAQEATAGPPPSAPARILGVPIMTTVVQPSPSVENTGQVAAALGRS